MLAANPEWHIVSARTKQPKGLDLTYGFMVRRGVPLLNVEVLPLLCESGKVWDLPYVGAEVAGSSSIVLIVI